MNRQQKRKVIKITNKSFDDIVKTSEKICKEFNVEKLPLITFRLVIDNSKLKMIDESDALMNFQKAFNQTLEILYKFCQVQSKKDNAVSMFVLKRGIESMKKGLIKGISNPALN